MKPYQMNKLWWFLGFLGLAIIMLGSLYPTKPGPVFIPHLDKAFHFIGYSVATFYFQQLTQNKKAILIFILLVFYGGIIEVLQGQSGYREMSALDMVANYTWLWLWKFN